MNNVFLSKIQRCVFWLYSIILNVLCRVQVQSSLLRLTFCDPVHQVVGAHTIVLSYNMVSGGGDDVAEDGGDGGGRVEGTGRRHHTGRLSGESVCVGSVRRQAIRRECVCWECRDGGHPEGYPEAFLGYPEGSPEEFCANPETVCV